MRVHEISRKYKISVGAVKRILREKNVEVRGHMSVIDDEIVKKYAADFNGQLSKNRERHEPQKFRVSEIAKELNISIDDVCDRLQDIGVRVRNGTNTVEGAVAENFINQAKAELPGFKVPFVTVHEIATRLETSTISVRDALRNHYVRVKRILTPVHKKIADSLIRDWQAKNRKKSIGK